MRREGFEMSVTPPEIMLRTDPKTQEILEPVEKVVIEMHPTFSTHLIEKMNNRKGVYLNSTEIDAERMKL
jgi:GTP-binding protein